MGKLVSRRDFIKSGTAAGLATATPRILFGEAPTVLLTNSVKPVVVSSRNGNTRKNGGPMTCIETAFDMITQGADVLDSLIAGVNIVELDPEDSSVGYGGLPNAEGVVQLDSCCMHGPKKRAGGVAALEGVRTPSLVAQAVMETTDHHLLVAQGAQTFARNMGFKIEDDLNTEKSRGRWLEWKRRIDPKHYLDPARRVEAGYRAGLQMVHDGLIDPDDFWGTINCNGVNAKGEVCGVTTTSGLRYKIPGRVGDSPIIGAGLFVDNEIGAAGSTGRGEAVIKICGAHTVVEAMRAGMSPQQACLHALKRIADQTKDQRLLRNDGRPNFDVKFYAVFKDGRYGAAAIWSGAQFAINTGDKSRHEDCAFLFERA